MAEFKLVGYFYIYFLPRAVIFFFFLAPRCARVQMDALAQLEFHKNVIFLEGLGFILGACEGVWSFL